MFYDYVLKKKVLKQFSWETWNIFISAYLKFDSKMHKCHQRALNANEVVQPKVIILLRRTLGQIIKPRKV